jgi:hypothetical protein
MNDSMDKSRRLFVWIVAMPLFLALATGAWLLAHRRPAVPRPVTLIVVEGEGFVASYTADGVAHRLSAVAPARIETQIRESFAYEIAREGGKQEFRVTLEVAGVKRLSSVSHQGGPVRGGHRFTNEGDTAWGG